MKIRMHGPMQERDEIELSKLIDILNEGFVAEFRPGDRLFFESILDDAVSDSSLRQAALSNIDGCSAQVMGTYSAARALFYQS